MDHEKRLTSHRNNSKTQDCINSSKNHPTILSIFSFHQNSKSKEKNPTETALHKT